MRTSHRFYSGRTTNHRNQNGLEIGSFACCASRWSNSNTHSVSMSSHGAIWSHSRGGGKSCVFTSTIDTQQYLQRVAHPQSQGSGHLSMATKRPYSFPTKSQLVEANMMPPRLIRHGFGSFVHS
mmetsp:Transcript_14768/g.41813  ORF Transcript_14768/g.41813 Transcript_14768/m.41813 type:complete len:124 (-) Transcript_14768:1101-1472(-)